MSETGSRARASQRNTTADRAIDLLLLFDEQRPVLLASTIAEELGMSKSTTYRYLQSLRSYGFLDEVDNRGGFRLGPQLLRLARIARQGMDLVALALPFMREVGLATGEAVLLTRRSGDQVICLERVESAHPVRISYERGHALPVHAGAQAKAQLAFEPADEVDRVLAAAGLRALTETTPVASDEIRRQLDRIRADGYAATHGEVDVGVTGVAAPVFGSGGRVVAALGLAGPDFRIGTAPGLDRAIEAVRTAAANLTDRLADIDG